MNLSFKKLGDRSLVASEIGYRRLRTALMVISAKQITFGTSQRRSLPTARNPL
jgi:hypothetical protein